MNEIATLFNKITSSRYHNKMIKSAEPLDIHLGVNHFWYNRMTFSGHYSYFGTHVEWHEYCHNRIDFIKGIPYLANPYSFPEGLQLLGQSSEPQLQLILKEGRTKYKTNFNLHFIRRTANALEGFGFGCRDNSVTTYDRLLNELNLLKGFIGYFREVNAPIFAILDEFQADMNKVPCFKFNKSRKNLSAVNRDQLLRDLGMGFPDLSSREHEVLQYCASGFPAPYIAEQMGLSIRTVESYILIIKSKLQCKSKVELIQKAKDLSSLTSFKL